MPDRRRVGWTDGQMDGCHGQMEEEDGGGERQMRSRHFGRVSNEKFKSINYLNNLLP